MTIRSDKVILSDSLRFSEPLQFKCPKNEFPSCSEFQNSHADSWYYLSSLTSWPLKGLLQCDNKYVSISLSGGIHLHMV